MAQCPHHNALYNLVTSHSEQHLYFARGNHFANAKGPCMKGRQLGRTEHKQPERRYSRIDLCIRAEIAAIFRASDKCQPRWNRTDGDLPRSEEVGMRSRVKICGIPLSPKLGERSG
jgi:hypothetical protein